jgi:hypothetical protein
VVTAPASTAKALALAISGAAALSAFPLAARAFTAPQCGFVQAVFTEHIRANAQHYSNEDKAELRKFNAWLTEGCVKGTSLVLVRHPEVGAALSVVQMFVNKAPDHSLRVSLSPTVSFVPFETGPIRPMDRQPSAPIIQNGAPRAN